MVVAEPARVPERHSTSVRRVFSPSPPAGCCCCRLLYPSLSISLHRISLSLLLILPQQVLVASARLRLTAFGTGLEPHDAIFGALGDWPAARSGRIGNRARSDNPGSRSFLRWPRFSAASLHPFRPEALTFTNHAPCRPACPPPSTAPPLLHCTALHCTPPALLLCGTALDANLLCSTQHFHHVSLRHRSGSLPSVLRSIQDPAGIKEKNCSLHPSASPVAGF